MVNVGDDIYASAQKYIDKYDNRALWNALKQLHSSQLNSDNTALMFWGEVCDAIEFLQTKELLSGHTQH